MKWSRELRIARRSMRTAIKAASAMAKARRSSRPACGAEPWRRHDTRARRRSDRGQGFRQQSRPAAMFVHVPSDRARAGGAADRAAARLRPGRGHLCPRRRLDCACRSAGGAAGAAGAVGREQPGAVLQLVSPDACAVAGSARRCRSGRWSPRRCSASVLTRAASSSPGSPPGVPWPPHCWRPIRTCSPPAPWSPACRSVPRDGTSEALRRMAEAGPPDPPAAWAELVRRRRAGRLYRGPWPRLSIWHGEADRVVDPANARCWPSNGRPCMA